MELVTCSFSANQLRGNVPPASRSETTADSMLMVERETISSGPQRRESGDSWPSLSLPHAVPYQLDNALEMNLRNCPRTRSPALAFK